MQAIEPPPNPPGSEPAFRAAQYVRMSTEHQQYSTENQGDKIREYAVRRNIEIIRTYADEGKSGLRIDGRQALQKLIKDVETGNADFEIILVYDVSRWGRFQDADESAYYEYICRRAGIQVAYCAEQFENDGSPVSTIVKGVKRAMAGEYSRELSAKVFAGQCRLIELGFRQGGPAGYGLRRVLIDQTGSIKSELARGEHKSLQTDRVILQPGPDAEVTVVNQIYRWFVDDNQTESEIADRLNGQGVRTDLGRDWTRATVREVLTNEKYIGNNVYNRRSFKLKKHRVINSPDMWIKKEGAFEGIVPPDLFFTAQGILRARAHRYSNVELIEKLRSLYQRHGYLSGLIIDEAEGMPSSAAYAHRFGSLIRAYQTVGFTPDRDYQYLEVNQFLRRLHPEIVGQTERMIAEVGGACSSLGPAVKPTVVNRTFTLCPYCQLRNGQIFGDGQGGQVCQCPDCGPIPLAADDRAAVMLDEGWLRSKLRIALEIESRDGVTDLGNGIWRLGEARREPVLLSRSLPRLWADPAVFDRIRVPGAGIRVIAPRAAEVRGVPFAAGIDWLPMEERFTFYGGGIAHIRPGATPEPPVAVDPWTPVHGPFSADFGWVTLDDWAHGPIRCTDGQAAVFSALWSFKGAEVDGERIMTRAGQSSDKPIDLFKVKTTNKGKPEYEGPLHAYRALVKTNRRQGVYWMPCASPDLASS